MEAPAELSRGGRERRTRRERLAERVDGSEPVRERAASRGLRDRKREEDRHRPAEAVAGDVESLQASGGSAVSACAKSALEHLHFASAGLRLPLEHALQTH